MYGYIYKTTCLITNQIYIGQHKADKFMNEQYLGSGVKLQRYIKHYGKENFIVECLATADSKEELDKLEIKYIALYNSTDSEIGLNIALGGSGVPLEYQTEETKLKISQANKGKKRTDETKEYLSQIRKGGAWVNNGEIQKHILGAEVEEYLSNGWVRGMLHKKSSGKKSLEARAKISKSNKGKKKTQEHIENHRKALKEKHFHWYTNGVDNKCIPEGETIPEGYYRGKTVPKDLAEKISKANKGKVPWNKKINIIIKW